MKHKHYEMIVAKAANVDLVVLIKSKVNNRWEVLDSVCIPSFYEDTEYFLCLPKHNEKGQCIHWLNGGDIQVLDSNWINVNPAESYPWEDEHDFMCEDSKIRIKPKKEKRWIAVLPNGRVGGWHDEGKEMLEEQYNKDAGWQFIEIEVEV
ncbi:hypothetical protein NVP1198B_76 [Vibrio phage 1.198.B._10N.286.54.F4]|nr:hypothetical protein NVP1198A_77 [Vibrio phage 1.198.A._10N.286.54.F4]AUR94864.1 hypothetical protein NVP1198B_76 [Vibrio phage 1.198.B._10N.286.54.F4]